MERTTVFLEDGMLEELKRLAKEKHVTMSDLVREGIRLLLDADKASKSLEQRVSELERKVEQMIGD